MNLIHATCISMAGAGVLLRGPSGAGKSDLALRLIDGGALLVADDQVLLTPEGGHVHARSPADLAGLLEVRGVGIMPVPSTAEVRLVLIADLAHPDAVDRLPDPDQAVLCGCRLPRIVLAPFEASAPAKLRLAVMAAAADRPSVPLRFASIAGGRS